MDKLTLMMWGGILVTICCVLYLFYEIISKVKECLHYRKHRNDEVFDYEDEFMILEHVLTSRDFDVIKVHASGQKYGEHGEQEWVKKKYPGYTISMQRLTRVETEQGMIVFDVFPIKKENIRKDIYFDITEYYEEGSLPYYITISRDVEEKIKELYK